MKKFIDEVKAFWAARSPWQRYTIVGVGCVILGRLGAPWIF